VPISINKNSESGAREMHYPYSRSEWVLRSLSNVWGDFLQTGDPSRHPTNSVKVLKVPRSRRSSTLLVLRQRKCACWVRY